MGDYLVGALVYADDIVLLSPSASSLSIMLAICDKNANDYCNSFNASKSKCHVVLPRKCRFLSDYIKACTFYVGNNPIEYVDSFKHLGHQGCRQGGLRGLKPPKCFLEKKFSE